MKLKPLKREKNYSLPDPIEAIKFRMEQLGYSQNDLAEIIGLKAGQVKF